MSKDDKPDLRLVTGDGAGEPEPEAGAVATTEPEGPGNAPDPAALYLELLRAGSGTHAALQATELTVAALAELREDEAFRAREAEALAAAREMVDDALFQAASSGNLAAITEYYRRTAEPDPLILELADECRKLAQGI